MAQMSRNFNGAFWPTSLPLFHGWWDWFSIAVSSRDFDGAPVRDIVARLR